MLHVSFHRDQLHTFIRRDDGRREQLPILRGVDTILHREGHAADGQAVARSTSLAHQQPQAVIRFVLDGMPRVPDQFRVRDDRCIRRRQHQHKRRRQHHRAPRERHMPALLTLWKRRRNPLPEAIRRVAIGALPFLLLRFIHLPPAPSTRRTAAASLCRGAVGS